MTDAEQHEGRVPEPRRRPHIVRYGKLYALAYGSVVLTIVFLVAWGMIYVWDASMNRGHTVGYWGEYNRIKQSLERIPGIVEIRDGYNDDAFLEEIFITVRLEDGAEFRIWFAQDDPRRELRGAAMQAMVEAEFAARLEEYREQQLVEAGASDGGRAADAR